MAGGSIPLFVADVDDGVERTDGDPLFGTGSLLDQRDRRLGSIPCLPERVGVVRELADAHQDDDGAARRGQGIPVDC